MKVFLALLFLVSSIAASAHTRLVSIDAFDYSYTGGLIFRSAEAKKGVSDYDETTFKLNLNYAQNTAQYVGLMWRVKAYINREDIDNGSDALDSKYGAAGGFLYNFQSESIKDSFFAGAMVGLERQNLEVKNNETTGYNIFLETEVGKRFDLGQYAAANISYAPSFGLNFKRFGGEIRDELYTSGTEVKFNFLKFDILF